MAAPAPQEAAPEVVEGQPTIPLRAIARAEGAAGRRPGGADAGAHHRSGGHGVQARQGVAGDRPDRRERGGAEPPLDLAPPRQGGPRRRALHDRRFAERQRRAGQRRRLRAHRAEPRRRRRARARRRSGSSVRWNSSCSTRDRPSGRGHFRASWWRPPAARAWSRWRRCSSTARTPARPRSPRRPPPPPAAVVVAPGAARRRPRRPRPRPATGTPASILAAVKQAVADEGLGGGPRHRWSGSVASTIPACGGRRRRSRAGSPPSGRPPRCSPSSTRPPTPRTTPRRWPASSRIPVRQRLQAARAAALRGGALVAGGRAPESAEKARAAGRCAEVRAGGPRP